MSGFTTVMPFEGTYAVVFSPDQPTEPNWQLQAIVIALSTGPNGFSDMVGATNASLVMSTVNGEGTTLRPSRPLIVADAALVDVTGHGLLEGDHVGRPRATSDSQLSS